MSTDSDASEMHGFYCDVDAHDLVGHCRADRAAGAKAANKHNTCKVEVKMRQECWFNGLNAHPFCMS